MKDESSPESEPEASDEQTLLKPEDGAVNAGETLAKSVPSIDELDTEIEGYTVLERLGEGGFGIVYRAEQTEPVRRDVAIKVLKPGMDSSEVISRFDAERQALAIMDHPNIASVLDAGVTAKKRPYFVMQFVNGIPITEYCDQHDLSIDARLDLFVTVCRAIQHAHQKGVIHRDIKPSNVLVSGESDERLAKVIDFGIAKAIDQQLSENAIFTGAGQILGTPLYMSPEQAEMNATDIDTRSDVYSLGVLLYELISGETPFTQDEMRTAAFDEMLRMIREVDPPRPSTRISRSRTGSHQKTQETPSREFQRWQSTVRGELDWIVMKSLEKDRGRRYDSALSFAEDIERFQNGDPVAAGPPSRSYRAKKFVTKHLAAISAGVAFLGLLVAAAVISTLLALQAIAAEQLASDRADEVTAEKLLTAKKADEYRDLAHKTSLQATDLGIRQGLQFMQRGELTAGLHEFVTALETAPEDATTIRSVIEQNIASWSRKIMTPVMQHEIDYASNAQIGDYHSWKEFNSFSMMIAPDLNTDLSLEEAYQDYYDNERGVMMFFSNEDLQPIGKQIAFTGDIHNVFVHEDSRSVFIQNLVEREQAPEPPISAIVDPNDPAAPTAESTDDARLSALNAWSQIDGTFEIVRMNIDTGEQIGPPIKLSGLFLSFLQPENGNEGLQMDLDSMRVLHMDHRAQLARVYSLEDGQQIGKDIVCVDAVIYENYFLMTCEADSIVRARSIKDMALEPARDLKHDKPPIRVCCSSRGSLATVTEDAIHKWGFYPTVHYQSPVLQHPPTSIMLSGSRVAYMQGKQLVGWNTRYNRQQVLRVYGQSDDPKLDITSDAQWLISRTDNETYVWEFQSEFTPVVSKRTSDFDLPGVYTYSTRHLYNPASRTLGIQNMTGRYSFWALPARPGEAIEVPRESITDEEDSSAFISGNGHIISSGSVNGLVQYNWASHGALMGRPPPPADGFVRLVSPLQSGGLPITFDTSIDGFSKLIACSWQPYLSSGYYEGSYLNPNEYLISNPAIAGVGFSPQDKVTRFSPDGLRIVTMDHRGRIYVRRVGSGERVSEATMPKEISTGGGLLQSEFSADLSVLIAVYYLTNEPSSFVGRFKTSTGEPIGQPYEVADYDQLVLSPYGRYVQILPQADVIDLTTGKTLEIDFVEGASLVGSFFSDDEKRLATVAVEGTVRVYNLETEQRLAEVRHRKPVSHLVFVNHAEQFVTCFLPGNWRLWDTDSGTLLLQGSSDEQTNLEARVNEDGTRMATSGVDGFIQQWDLKSGISVGPPVQATRPVRDFIYTCDDQLVVVGQRDITAWPRVTLSEISQENMRAWIETLTRTESLDGGNIRGLEESEVSERLTRLGGSWPELSTTLDPLPKVWMIDAGRPSGLPTPPSPVPLDGSPAPKSSWPRTLRPARPLGDPSVPLDSQFPPSPMADPPA